LIRYAVVTGSCDYVRRADKIYALQALLDVYTIQREIGHLDNVRIGLVGDLANGRTARSLAYLMSMYKGVKVYFVAPEVVRMGDDIKDFLTSKNVSWEEADDLSQAPPPLPPPLTPPHLFQTALTRFQRGRGGT
jgi:aspartate carbamoyltransferase catalytic subunit